MPFLLRDLRAVIWPKSALRKSSRPETCSVRSTSTLRRFAWLLRAVPAQEAHHGRVLRRRADADPPRSGHGNGPT